MGNKKQLLLAAGAVILAGGSGYWLASPYLAVNEFRDGARSHDPEKIIRHVDFPALREDLKGQIIAFMTRKLQSDATMASNPFSGIATAFLMPMVNSMIDTYLTPSGVRGLISASSSTQSSRGTEGGNPIADTIRQQGNHLDNSIADAQMSYAGLNRFVVTTKTSEGKPVSLNFNRSGFADWKLVSINLPSE